MKSSGDGEGRIGKDKRGELKRPSKPLPQLPSLEKLKSADSYQEEPATPHQFELPDQQAELVAKLKKNAVRPAHEPRILARISQLLNHYQDSPRRKEPINELEQLRNLLPSFKRCVHIFSQAQKLKLCDK